MGLRGGGSGGSRCVSETSGAEPCLPSWVGSLSVAFKANLAKQSTACTPPSHARRPRRPRRQNGTSKASETQRNRQRDAPLHPPPKKNPRLRGKIVPTATCRSWVEDGARGLGMRMRMPLASGEGGIESGGETNGCIAREHVDKWLAQRE